MGELEHLRPARLWVIMGSIPVTIMRAIFDNACINVNTLSTHGMRVVSVQCVHVVLLVYVSMCCATAFGGSSSPRIG